MIDGENGFNADDYVVEFEDLDAEELAEVKDRYSLNEILEGYECREVLDALAEHYDLMAIQETLGVIIRERASKLSVVLMTKDEEYEEASKRG